MKLKKYSSALKDFQSAHDLEPGNAQLHELLIVDAWHNLGWIRHSMKNHTEALEAWMITVLIFTSTGGNVYLDLNDYHAAIADYTKATAINPKSRLFLITISVVLTKS